MYWLAVVSLFLLLGVFLPNTVDAAHNPNLSVSAENSRFNNHFAGSMVVEVVVYDPNISKLDENVGEPDVTINGKKLRMVQSNDGNWYAYFANKDKALEADKTAFVSSTSTGKGLDFGVFCGPQTSSSVLGIDFSATDGIAISSDLTGATNGNSSPATCTGTPSGTSKMNVLRNAKGLNQNSQVPVGQVGIKADIWPVIQLFSFGSNVEIKYRGAGGTQSVNLSYDDIENISIALDRQNYPTNADVFTTIYDMQLNQDPTDQDSWTFSVGTTQRTFYFAFTGSGADAATGTNGLVNIVPSLSSLGFENNGKLTVSLGSIGELKTNNIQPSSSINDGGANTFSSIVTFVETSPNSGIFTNSDYSGKSNLKISNSAPRGQSATMTYNDVSVSIVSGSATASIALDSDASLKVSTLLPGKRAAVTLIDNDLNIRSATKDDLHVYDSTAIIPSIQIGSPVTLEKASEVKFFLQSGTDLNSPLNVDITSRVNDTNSDILIINTKNAGTSNFEKISINLGITANTLQNLLIDSSASDSDGTNWINYDLRSFERQLAISDFSDTTMTLYFGSLGSNPVQILDAGDISSARGFVQLDNDDVVSIKSKSGTVFLVINFDSLGNTDGAGRIASETDTQPIVFDIFSIGEVSSSPINNAIYRLELKETQANSGTFEGSIELTQSNQFDSTFVKNTVTTTSDNVRLLINQRLLDEKGIDLKYSDIASAGFNFDISSQQDVPTSTGRVTLNSQTFNFGHPVIVTLIDPDLNQKHDTREIYLTSNNPNSENVDAVVDGGGNLLLEVLLKDIRYKRCTVNGVEKGGLASTGFTLVETGPATGVFEGIFRMPTQICNKDGTRLISTAGGSVDVKYHDARDASGNPNIFGLTFFKNVEQAPQPKVSERKVPSWIKNSAKSWADNKVDDNTFATSIQYMINQKIIVTATEKSTIKYGSVIPDWIRSNAGWWANGQISENDFLNAIEYLVDQGIIKVP